MTQETKKSITMDFANLLVRIRRMKFTEKEIHSVRPSEFFILMNLRSLTESEPGGVKISKLSSFQHITPAAVTHIIDSLVKKGFVERLNNPNDRRIVLIRLTAKGIRFIEKTDKRMMDRLESLIDFLGEKDGKELIRLLTSVFDFFGKNTTDAYDRTDVRKTPIP